MKSRTIAEVLAKAEEFEEQEKYEQAYECYKYAYESDKSNEDVLSKLAICAQTLEYKEDAIKYCNIMLSLNPQNHLPYTQLMDLYFSDNKYEYYMTRAKLKTLEGRLEQATSDYKKALSNTSEDELQIKARYLLAQTYEILDKSMQAIDEYLRILDYKHDENVYAALAKIYYNTDKTAAISVLNQGLTQYPDNQMFKELLSKIYMELGEYSKALDYSTSPLNTAKLLLLQDNNQAALNILEGLSAQDKKSPRYLALMAEYYYNTDNNALSLEYVDKYESVEPQSLLVPQMKALIYEKEDNSELEHFYWGKFYLKKGSLDLALNEFLNAYAANKANTDIIKELINLYVVLGDRVASIEFSEKLVEIEKDDVPTLKKLVKFYDEEGYPDKMVHYLLQLSEINSKDYDTILRLARYYESNRQMGEAIEFYEKYLKFAPSSELRDEVDAKLKLLTSADGIEEEGFLDKLLKIFSKK